MLAVVFLGGGAAFGRCLVGGGEGFVVGRDVSGEDMSVRDVLERQADSESAKGREWITYA